MNERNEEDFFGNDVLDEEQEKMMENEYEDMLKGLHGKVQNLDAAKQWLRSDLGIEFRKFLVADEIRTMKICSTSEDEKEVEEAKIDLKAISKLKQIFGTIIADGIDALQTLQQEEGDSDGN